MHVHALFTFTEVQFGPVVTAAVLALHEVQPEG
jgi:hypothetical protein